jgi:hypothetical protein
MKADRHAIYKKFNGRCAYSGTCLESDWEIDHLIPRRHCGKDNTENLVPAQKIINHYKRALDLEDFRKLWLGGLHLRLSKLPKKPRTAKGHKRKAYLLEVARLFGITPDKPFSGVFFFETLDVEDVMSEHKRSEIVICHTCGGVGHIELSERIDYHHRIDAEWDETCTNCEGSGRIVRVTVIKETAYKQPPLRKKREGEYG